MKFLADDQREITGIQVWNCRGNEKTWEAELSIDDLRAIAFKFVGLIEQNDEKESRDD